MVTVLVDHLVHYVLKLRSNPFVHLLIISRTLEYRFPSARLDSRKHFLLPGYRKWVGISSWKLTCLKVSKRRELLSF